MEGMFSYAEAFNQDIRNWTLSSVTNMQSMFWYAEAFNQAIGNWDVSSVTDMGGMFSQALNFNQISGIGMSLLLFPCELCFGMQKHLIKILAIGMYLQSLLWSGCLRNRKYLIQNISNWNISSVTDMDGMFVEAEHCPNKTKEKSMNHSLQMLIGLIQSGISMLLSMNQIFKKQSIYG